MFSVYSIIRERCREDADNLHKLSGNLVVEAFDVLLEVGADVYFFPPPEDCEAIIGMD